MTWARMKPRSKSVWMTPAASGAAPAPWADEGSGARRHPLAGVHGAFNAVFVQAQNAGELMFYGPGAGGAPTASSFRLAG